MKMVLNVFEPWPSQNDLNKMHYMKRHRLMKELCTELAALAWTQNFRQWKAAGFQYFTHVDLYRIGRIKDRGNLVGGAKHLIDAIVNCGFIEDDSDDKVKITYVQGPRNDPLLAAMTDLPLPLHGSIVVLRHNGGKKDV